MLSNRTINYAVPPPGSFWAWSTEYDAIEWYDGSTLAMWQELHGILRYLRDDSGLPPLGAILLLLAACRDEWLALCIAFHEKAMAILGVTERDAISPEIKDTLVRGLKTVNDLPKDLRASFPAKCLLVSALFEGGPYSLPREDSHQILAELTVRGPLHLRGLAPEMTARQRFIRDVRALKTGLARHDAASLETRLRTGLESLEILPASLPDLPPDDHRPLLDRLAANGGQSGAAAAVAKRTIAMLNFPGGFSTPEDLPVGGISDITNRGTVDRLLPGELAWDDLVLAARLVHNEALYFRREIPPRHLAIGHTVLMDRGLRLWGTGRVFALGVALGLRHHPAMNGPGETFECVAATGDGYEHLDLGSPEGVFSALETLVPAPRPDAFLTAWHDSAAAADDESVPDVSFITAAAHLGDAGTRRLLGEIAAWIHAGAGRFRVIALDRGGEVEMQMWSPGGNRTLFLGKVELDDIVSAAPAPAQQPAAPPLRAKPDPLHGLLPIYGEEKLPILFPEIPQGSAILRDYNSPESPVTGVTSGGRLMRWPRTGWGGYIWVDKIPGRQHWIGLDDRGEAIVIASGRQPGDTVRVFRLDKDRLNEVAITASRHPFPRQATVSGGAVLLAYLDSVEAISLATGNRVAETPWSGRLATAAFGFDGERIRVFESGMEQEAPLRHWPFGDVFWPRFFTADAVALDSGILMLKDGDKSFRFDPLKLGWDEVGNPSRLPATAFTPFRKSTVSSAAGVDLEVARLSPRLDVWRDTRGILHLRPSANPASTWSILLSTTATSFWHADHGLCSMEPRLRLPDTKEPEIRSLQMLHRFLSEQSPIP